MLLPGQRRMAGPALIKIFTRSGTIRFKGSKIPISVFKFRRQPVPKTFSFFHHRDHRQLVTNPAAKVSFNHFASRIFPRFINLTNQHGPIREGPCLTQPLNRNIIGKKPDDLVIILRTVKAEIVGKVCAIPFREFYLPRFVLSHRH